MKKKINGFEIKRKNGIGAGWMAHSYGEAICYVDFLAKSENMTIDDYIITEKTYEF